MGIIQVERERAVAEERERCATIADDLAERWEASAAECRAAGRVRAFFIGPHYIAPSAERDARAIEAGAHGVRAIARLIRSGAVRRPPAEQGEE